ncbi:MAG: hypothetical protein P4L61_02310 [Candidatus Pacebacteria bacterium]|nr:hypothetical protein [Candidatus Paceibacterota bacterium]
MDTNPSPATENQTPTIDFTNGRANKNAAMAVLSYLGPLIIISYIVSNKDHFVKFHIKQGLVLLVIEVAIWIIGSLIWMLWPLMYLANIGVLVLAIIGIINAVKSDEKPLPLVGKYASYFKI